MTKRDIAKSISERAGIPRGQVLSVIQSVLDGIIETLVGQGRIELRNFGVFEVRKRKARKARNPRTGEAVAVPEHLGISFKAGLEMQERVEQSRHYFQRQSLPVAEKRASSPTSAAAPSQHIANLKAAAQRLGKDEAKRIIDLF